MNALVLEGGGMRAMFTAGVLDVFIRQQILFPTIVGVSAGALFGVNLPSKQLMRVLRYNKRFLNDRRYMGLYSLLTTGNIVNKDFSFYELPSRLDPFDQETFNQSQCNFYLSATNVNSGEAEYFKIHDVFQQMELFRATSAMPFVSKMVEWQGQYYLDGGIADSIPFQYAQSLGCQKLVVVLTRDLDYQKKPMSAWPIKLCYRRYPQLAAKLQQRHQIYNQQITQLRKLEQQGKAFIIRPPEPLNISRLEKNWINIQAVYDSGIAEAERRLSNLQQYLNS